MILKRKASLLLAPLGLTMFSLAAAHPASATVEIYNFVTGVPGGPPYQPLYTGVGVLGNGSSTTATWNTVDYSGSTNQNSKVDGVPFGTALDSNSNASTVGISYGADGQANGFNSTSPASTDPNALLQNFAYNKSGNAENIDLTGLADNAAYTLVFYGINGNYATTYGAPYRPATFSILSGELGAAGTTVVSSATTEPTNNDTSFYNNGTNSDYVELTGTTSATGTINASYSGVVVNNGYEADFNGLQVEMSAAPEPSQIGMMALMGLGLGGLLLNARKRSGFAKLA